MDRRWSWFMAAWCAGGAAFVAQKPLQEDFRLVLPHRRGYGDNPLPRASLVEDADDVIELLGDGVHLLGTSVGGVVAMLAAGKRPELIKSLTVIEPPALNIATDVAEVGRVAAAIKAHFDNGQDMDCKEFTKGFLNLLDLGIPLPRSTEQNEKAMRSLKTEKPWDLQLPIEAIAEADYPKMVVSGGWSDVFEAVADRLGDLLIARREIIRGSGHSVQRQRGPFNELLVSFLSGAE